MKIPTKQMHEFAFIQMIQAAMDFRIEDPVTYDRKLEILHDYLKACEEALYIETSKI